MTRTALHESGTERFNDMKRYFFIIQSNRHIEN